MDMYRVTILEHYKHPRNFGTLDHPSGKAKLHNTACGDIIEMTVKVSPDGKTIDDVKFSGEGCAISVASASLLTEKVKGLATAKTGNIKPDDIYKLLGTELTPARTKCALLGLEVLEKALLEAKANNTV